MRKELWAWGERKGEEDGGGGGRKKKIIGLGTRVGALRLSCRPPSCPAARLLLFAFAELMERVVVVVEAGLLPPLFLVLLVVACLLYNTARLCPQGQGEESPIRHMDHPIGAPTCHVAHDREIDIPLS